MVSFGASFAFFGLAGFLQNGTVFDPQPAVAAGEQSSSQPEVDVVSSGVASDANSVNVSAPTTGELEWLGPVQPLPTAPAAPADAPAAVPVSTPSPAPAPAPTPAPAPVEVDAHTGGS